MTQASIPEQAARPAAAGELPEGWAEAALPQIANLNMGQSPPGSSYNEEGQGLPFFQGKADFGDRHPSVRVWCTQPTKIAQPGDVLISVRAPVGPTNVADHQCAIGRGLAAFTPLGGIATEFLLFALRLQEPELALSGAGSTFTAINKSDIENIVISVPPLQEQLRIIEKIEELLAHLNRSRNHLFRVPAILKRFRQAVLAAACSGRLTEDWRLRHGSSESTPASEVPETWRSVNLKTITNVIDPNPSHRYPSYENGTIPILATEQFKGLEGWDTATAKLVNNSFHAERNGAHGFRKDDIIFARKGRIGLARRPPRLDKYVFSHTLFIVRTRSGTLSTFLLWFLRQDSCVAWLLHEMNSNTGVPTLGKSYMENLPIDLLPIDEQQEIVRRVHQLFDLAQRVEEQAQLASSHVHQLTRAILAKAFRGDLVPTEAELARREGREYESASVLLERIKKERTNEPKSAKRGRKSVLYSQ